MKIPRREQSLWMGWEGAEDNPEGVKVFLQISQRSCTLGEVVFIAICNFCFGIYRLESAFFCRNTMALSVAFWNFENIFWVVFLRITAEWKQSNNLVVVALVVDWQL